MSSSPNPQHEPTMEEILASIRKIISEDQPDAAKPAAQPIQVRAAAAQTSAVAAESDVLELTEEVHEEVALPPQPDIESPLENDIAFENIESEPKAKPDMDQDELISDSARSAVGRAFAKLEMEPPKPSPPPVAGGALDALFT